MVCAKTKMRNILAELEAFKGKWEKMSKGQIVEPLEVMQKISIFTLRSTSERPICFSCGKSNGRCKSQSQGGNGETNQRSLQ